MHAVVDYGCGVIAPVCFVKIVVLGKDCFGDVFFERFAENLGVEHLICQTWGSIGDVDYASVGEAVSFNKMNHCGVVGMGVDAQ